MKKLLLIGILVAVAGVTAQAMQPPDRMNYQGVLRDSDDKPLDGTYSMVFRFFDSPTGGVEILVDTHSVVTVSSGLFTVHLGGGAVTDGAGDGIYTSLSRMFGNHGDLFVEVQVAGETLAPRVRIVSAGYALNTHYVRGLDLVSDGPLDLHVDALDGNDANDGLDPERAKATIGAALAAMPLILGGPVTVHIADGVYHEGIGVGLVSRRGPYPITIVGNEAFPQNVVLDGQSVLETGFASFDPGVSLRGIEIRGFEEAVEVGGAAGALLANCRIIQNGNDSYDPAITVNDAAWCDIVNCVISGNAGIGVRATKSAHLELTETEVSGNSGGGVEIRGSDLRLQNATITGNGGAAIHAMLSEISARGGVQITGNDFGVYAAGNSHIDFFNRVDIDIQSNTSGDLMAESHSTVRGYGSGTTGTCVEADAHSMCVP